MQRKRRRQGQPFQRRRRPFVRARRPPYERYATPTGELKFHDVDVDDAVIASNGVIHNGGTINIIPQGVTEKTRVGRKCTIRSIMWRYNLELVSGATVGSAETVRCILYLDKQCNGATATITGILESNDFQSFNNLSNSGRFRMLYDKVHVLNPAASAGDGTANDTASIQLNDAFYHKCNIPIEFDSTTGVLTEVRSNNLGILTVSESGNIAKLNSKIRLRFSDS